ncbi:hypothetical protein H7H51_22100 [Mycolicibacterium farcinogenes]|nr:hypothetical protein [Mycolicibacterium farcinogenes]
MRVPTWLPVNVAVAFGGIALYGAYRAVGAWRDWHPPHIELGNLSEALGALFTVAAVVAALRIANNDRRERIRERHDQEMTHARLVLLLVEPRHHPSAAITVEVRNFGRLPILDVELADAAWTEHPTARVEVSFGQYVGIGFPKTAYRRPVLMPTREFERKSTTVVDFGVVFKHEADDRPLTEATARTANYQIPSYEPIDLSKVAIKIRFTTADGVRWETSTEGGAAGDPVRLGSSAEK